MMLEDKIIPTLIVSAIVSIVSFSIAILSQHIELRHEVQRRENR